MKPADIASLDAQQRLALLESKRETHNLMGYVLCNKDGKGRVTLKTGLDAREAVAALKFMDALMDEIIQLDGAGDDSKAGLQTRLQAMRRDLERVTEERDRLKAIVSGASLGGPEALGFEERVAIGHQEWLEEEPSVEVEWIFEKTP